MKALRVGFLFLFFPAVVWPNQVIDVAVVFSSDSSISTAQKAVYAASTELFLAGAFSPFSYSFDIHLVPVDVPISTTGKQPQAVVDAMQSNTATKLLRNTLGDNGADLMLMFASTSLSGDCGFAGVPKLGQVFPPLGPSISERDHAAFAVIFVDQPGCGPLDRIVPHEIGHLMYAEHQVAADNNGNISKPSNINHGISSGSQRSIMYDPVKSQTVPLWSGSPGLAGNRENNKLWLANPAVINAVSNYRSVPSVGCGSYFIGCPVNCGHSPYMLSWSSPTATSYKVQHKLFGSWKSYYTGSGLSTLASTGTVFSEEFRVQGVNAVGPGNWCTIWIQVQCSETQDPW